MGMFSDHEISVECPHCGHEIKKKLGRLDGHYNCPSCGGGIEFNGGSEVAGQAQKLVDDFARDIKRLFK